MLQIMQCLLLKNWEGYKSKSIKYLTPSEVNHHPTKKLKEEPFCQNISKSAIFKGKKNINLSPWAKTEHL